MSGEKAILFDGTLCIGCHSCYIACKKWNGLPEKSTKEQRKAAGAQRSRITALNWLSIESSIVENNFFSRPLFCFHCTDAHCVRACPEHAIYDKNGWKVVDQEKCIGCGSCVKSCPYGTVALAGARDSQLAIGETSIMEGRAYKCDGCKDNFGETPKCVLNCPTGALQYDFRLKLIQVAQKRFDSIKKENPKAQLIGINEFKGQSVIAIYPVEMEQYSATGRGEFDKKITATNMLYSALSFFAPSYRSVSSKIYTMAKFITTGKWT